MLQTCMPTTPYMKKMRPMRIATHGKAWKDLMKVQSRVRMPSPLLRSFTSLMTRNRRKKLMEIMFPPGWKYMKNNIRIHFSSGCQQIWMLIQGPLQRSVLFDRIYLLQKSNCKFSDFDIKRLQINYMQFNFIICQRTPFYFIRISSENPPYSIKASNFKIDGVVEE